MTGPSPSTLQHKTAAREVIAAVAAAMLTFLATMAYSGATGISRVEVDRLVQTSESRMMAQIVESKVRQNQILDKLELIAQEQVRLATKVDIILKGSGK